MKEMEAKMLAMQADLASKQGDEEAAAAARDREAAMRLEMEKEIEANKLKAAKDE